MWVLGVWGVELIFSLRGVGSLRDFRVYRVHLGPGNVFGSEKLGFGFKHMVVLGANPRPQPKGLKLYIMPTLNPNP